jgi:THAP domain
MPNKCLVPGCGSSYRKNPSLNFFSFVRSQDRRLLWIAAIEKGIGKKKWIDHLSIDDVVSLIRFKFQIFIQDESS